MHELKLGQGLQWFCASNLTQHSLKRGLFEDPCNYS